MFCAAFSFAPNLRIATTGTPGSKTRKPLTNQNESIPIRAGFVMDWVDAVASELDRLDGQLHANKKRNTVLALVDIRLSGGSEESVWTRPTTCNRSTWHLKWKRDPLLMDVLGNVERLARRWTDTRTIRALQEAAEKLMLASPAAAGKAIALMLSEDDAVALRAAFGVLDRAGVETAPKQQQQHGLTPELESLIERVYGQPEEAEE